MDISQQSKEALKRDFLKILPINQRSTRKLFTLGFIGLVGSGKSFIAEKLSKRLGIYVASNDAIRRFLNGRGIDGKAPSQMLVQDIAEASTEFLFQHKSSHIIDADLIKFHETARENSAKHGAVLVLVRITCPEEIILQRLESRRQDVHNLSLAGEDVYFQRKALHEALSFPETYFTIDSTQDVDGQIEMLVKKLEQDGVL